MTVMYGFTSVSQVKRSPLVIEKRKNRNWLCWKKKKTEKKKMMMMKGGEEGEEEDGDEEKEEEEKKP